MARDRPSRMRRFWDARAREDPYYFINNTLEYRHPDLERFWHSGPEDVDRILDLLGARISPSDVVVEIGCGLGRMTRPLAGRSREVHALDVSAEMIAGAQRHNPELENVRWILGDGHSLAGIEDSSADACVSFVVFQHIPDPEITLGYVREIGRVLRPDGWAAVQVSDAPSVHRPKSPAGRVREALGAAVGRLPRGRSHPAWRGSAVDPQSLREAAADAGMECERIVGERTQFCFVLLRRGRPG